MKNRRSLSSPGLPAVGAPSGDSAGAPPGEAPGVASPAGVYAMRRGGVRSEMSDRVTLRNVAVDDAGTAPGERSLVAQRVFQGWALNMSRGGVRCILEEKVELGEEYEVTVGDVPLAGEAGEARDDKPPLTRLGRIVWLQEEADGVIVGVEFLSPSGTHPAAPPSHAAAPVDADDPDPAAR